MKKRCTNSACRKEFILQPGSAVCPHCGKSYPRTRMPVRQRRDARPKKVRAEQPKKAAPVRRSNTFAVVLLGCTPGSARLELIRTMRALTGASLHAAVEATKRPTVVFRSMPWESAEIVALQLEQQGGTVALISTGEAEKYGVPLSGG